MNFTQLIRCLTVDHQAQGATWWFSAKESACSAGDKGSIPGMGRCHGEVNGNPVEYSSLGNPMDRGACGFTVHGVARVGHDLASKQQ